MTGLDAVDWVVLGVYLLIVGGLGLAASRRVATAGEMSLAGRSMPAWAVSVSVLATSLSAVTFIGAPQDAYIGDLTYLSLSIGTVLGAVIVATVFLPRYYAAGVTSVYEVVGTTGSVRAQRACTLVFLAGRMLASGARLYVAAIPCSLIVFGKLEAGTLLASIAMLTVVALLYTSSGGIRAVIWTDVLQAGVFVIAAVVSIWVLLRAIPLDLGGIAGELTASENKLRLLDFSTDLEKPYTLWSALIGFTLLSVAAYGTDQDLAQRTLTCRSARRAAGSLIAASVVGIGMAGVFLVIGLLLYVAHRTGAIGGNDAGDTRRVYVDFILSETPAGVRGAMLAGVFAAAMSSLDSALNAMSTAAQAELRHEVTLRQSRLLNIGFGALLALTAGVFAVSQGGRESGLIPFALGVMVYAYAGLLGVFVSVLVFRRGSSVSILGALLGGAVVVAVLQWGHTWVGVPIRVSLGWRMAAGTLVSFAIAVSGATRAVREAGSDV